MVYEIDTVISKLFSRQESNLHQSESKSYLDPHKWAGGLLSKNSTTKFVSGKLKATKFEYFLETYEICIFIICIC